MFCIVNMKLRIGINALVNFLTSINVLLTLGLLTCNVYYTKCLAHKWHNLYMNLFAYLYIMLNMINPMIMYNCRSLYIISTAFGKRDEFENVFENHLFLEISEGFTRDDASLINVNVKSLANFVILNIIISKRKIFNILW